MLDHTYAACVDHKKSWIFYALAAAENLLIYGADVTNAFGDAPPPKQGLQILPDKAFKDWWTIHKRRPPLPAGHVIPVLAAIQGHPEAPRLWARYADKILRNLKLTPTIHEPCLYSGMVDGARVLLKRQVDDFEVATASPRVAALVFDEINDYLTFPLKRMGLVTLFNVHQTRDYIKISVETYLERICEKHLMTWMSTTQVKPTTPLPNRREFIRGFLLAVGSDDETIQKVLADEMGLGYRSGVGESIFALVTARPDIAYAVTRLSQHNQRPHRLHFVGLRHLLRYLYDTRTDGI